MLARKIGNTGTLLSALLFVLYVGFYRNLFNLGIIQRVDFNPVLPTEYAIQMIQSGWLYEQLGHPNTNMLGVTIQALLNNPGISQKIILLVPMPLAGLTMYSLLHFLRTSHVTKILASMVFSLNPFTIDQFAAGPSILLVYAFSPLILLLMLQILDGQRVLRNTLLFAISLGFVSLFNIQAPVLLAPFATIPLAYITRRWKSIRRLRILVAFLLMPMLLLLLSLPTYLSFFATGATQAKNSGVGSTSYLVQAIVGTNANPEVATLRWFFTLATMSFAIPLLALKRSRLLYGSLFLASSTLVVTWHAFSSESVLYVLAGLPIPFSWILPWGNFIKIILPLMTAYVLMASLAIESMIARVQISHLRSVYSLARLRNGWYIGYSVLIVGLLLSPILVWGAFSPFDAEIRAFFSGSQLSPYEIPPAYSNAKGWLSLQGWDASAYRILWLPLDPRSFVILSTTIPNMFFGDNETNRDVLAPLVEGSTINFGRLAGQFNVKYVIVNLDIQVPQEWHQGQPRLLGWGSNWFAVGNPNNFVSFLTKQADMRQIAQQRDFVVFENLAFVSKISVYDKLLFVPPSSMLNNSSTRRLYNYTSNLVSNGNFGNGFSSWSTNGNWSIGKDTPQQVGYSAESRQTTAPANLVQALNPVKQNSGYYFSASMKSQNVKQSHIVLVLWNSALGARTATVVVQPPVDGTKNWWNVSMYIQTPPKTNQIQIYMVGGYSLDGKTTGDTWFANVSIEEAYLPLTSPVFEQDYQTYLSNLPLSFPTTDVQGTLVVQADGLPSNELETYGHISTAILFLGNPSATAIGNMFISKQIISLFEAETSLVPETGYWTNPADNSSSYGHVAEISGNGSARLPLVALYDGFYRISISLSPGGPFLLGIENQTLGLNSIGKNVEFRWFETAKVYLTRGMHDIDFAFQGNETVVDQIAVHYEGSKKDESFVDLIKSQPALIDVRKTGLVSYQLRTVSANPLFVVFGESYDANWKAISQNATIHLLAVGWANGFYVNATGNISLEIIYLGQQRWHTALIIASSTWLGLVLAISAESLHTRRRASKYP